MSRQRTRNRARTRKARAKAQAARNLDIKVRRPTLEKASWIIVMLFIGILFLVINYEGYDLEVRRAEQMAKNGVSTTGMITHVYRNRYDQISEVEVSYTTLQGRPELAQLEPVRWEYYAPNLSPGISLEIKYDPKDTSIVLDRQQLMHPPHITISIVLEIVAGVFFLLCAALGIYARIRSSRIRREYNRFLARISSTE